jgi:hypothetical protein
MKLSSVPLLLVYPNCGLDTNPTLALLLESLAARRVEVDVLLYEGEGYRAPSPYGDTIHLQFLPGEWFYDYQWASLRSMPMRVLRKVLFPWRYPGYSIRKDLGLFKLMRAKRYAAIIGVDPYGIILADMLNQRAHRPLIYLSFELMFMQEVLGMEDEYLKYLELAACERTALVLIQDEERGEVFCRENAVPREKLAFVPAAPPPQAVPRSERLRRMLDIPRQKRIVLYCGNLDVCASRNELDELVSYWPEEYALVLHHASQPSAMLSHYVKQLTGTGKVFVSDQPVARGELLDLVASADFGLAPYKPVPDRWWSGSNLHHLGFSSGKVGYYALCGLPILARSLPVFEREFAKYGCGKTYRRLADTGSLLKEMDTSYSRCSTEARRFYAERLNPTSGMKAFIDRLLKLVGM